MEYRSERDSMGEMKIPATALYGASTQRALQNFPISGLRFPRIFIRALGLIKMAAAQTNRDLGFLPNDIATAIISAAEEVMEGKHDEHFVVDIFQTGSGTSTNMNTNEVIANLALKKLGQPLGSKKVHPNDHVNLGQSSNDVIPTAIHVSAMEALKKELLPALNNLKISLNKKTQEFKDIIKIGRTHLQDATPITLGQEFSGYAEQIRLNIERLEATLSRLEFLAIGGTAVGTGVNTHKDFAAKVCHYLSHETGLSFEEAPNHFEAQAAKDTCAEVSGGVKTLAISLMKISNDIRWLASGPRCGLNEIALPATQPGSSIMPGKINPVIPEAVCQVAAQIIGNDSAVTVGCALGNFELNVMMPVIARNLLESLQLAARSCVVFKEKCIDGISANRTQCEETIEKSLALVTSLVPHIGYDKAAELAKKAFETGKTIRQVCEEAKILPKDKLDEALDPRSMLHPKSS